MKRSARWWNAFGLMQAKYGANSLGVLSTGQLVTEEFYTLGKLTQLGFGTNNYDGNTTLCMASAVAGYKSSFGSDGPPGSYEDIEKADVVLLIGANIADNHPILCQYLDSNPDRTLIVADPRVSKTAMMADLHLPLKPRSDLALLNGIAHILIRHNLIDREYIHRHTTGFDDLAHFLERYSPHRVCAITGLSEELLYKTAFLYAYTARVVVYRGQYAGTWSGKNGGGKVFGKLTKASAQGEAKAPSSNDSCPLCGRAPKPQ